MDAWIVSTKNTVSNNDKKTASAVLFLFLEINCCFYIPDSKKLCILANLTMFSRVQSFFLPKKYKRYILAIYSIDWRYTMTTSLTKQYNFKINESSMEQARAIIKEKGMTMTDAISLFIEQIVLEQDLPIKTAEDLHRERLIQELQAQSERALREYESGQGTSLDDMRLRYGL